MKLHPRVSKTTVDLVKRFEGLRRRAAHLPDGGWTIGYGHTQTAREGAEVTPEEAELLLRYDLSEVATRIDAWTFTPLNQNQFEALNAFAYNIGLENFRRSTVLKRVNEGQHLQAASAMELWRKTEVDGEGVVADALVRRRAAEKAHYLTPPEGFAPSPSQVLRPVFDYSVIEAAAQSYAARHSHGGEAPSAGEESPVVARTASPVVPEGRPPEAAEPSPVLQPEENLPSNDEAGAPHEDVYAWAEPVTAELHGAETAKSIAEAVPTQVLHAPPEDDAGFATASSQPHHDIVDPLATVALATAAAAVVETAGQHHEPAPDGTPSAAAELAEAETAPVQNAPRRPTLPGLSLTGHSLFEPRPSDPVDADDAETSQPPLFPGADASHEALVVRGFEPPPSRFNRTVDRPLPSPANEFRADAPEEPAPHPGDFNLFDRPLAPPEPRRIDYPSLTGPALVLDDKDVLRTVGVPRSASPMSILQDRTVLFSAIGLIGVSLFTLAIFTMLLGKATPWHLLIGALGVALIVPASVYFMLRRMGDLPTPEHLPAPEKEEHS